MSLTYLSPLRYPGGKGKLANYIKQIVRINGLCDCHYIEPYAGGAGVALELVVQEYASHIHINDINYSVYAFWHSLINETEALCALIEQTEVSVDNWQRQKEIQLEPQQHDLLEVGFSTFFLNRTNRSGILNGGMIGGKAQDGDWRLDARYNSQELIKRIRLIARYRRRITVYNLDAEQLLGELRHNLPQNAFTYFDPPYFVKGQDLYDNHYTPKDHARLANFIRDQFAERKWMVSYDNHPEICTLYEGYSKITYQLNYSARQRYKGSEVIFFSRELAYPADVRPVPYGSSDRGE